MSETDNQPGSRPRDSVEPDRPLAGVLVIDKPPGRSSMSVVAEIRRRSGRTKTGHAGTLDPLATGVLVLALGRATKAIDRLMATEKRYETTIDLSAFTATDDAEAEPEPVTVDTPPTTSDIETALERFTGTIEQHPPAFSAVKVGGRRSYKLARTGRDQRPPARAVVVYAIELASYTWPILTLRIHSAKGFYVRSLARDLGTALGTGGYCTSIRRTAVGPFTLEHARTLEALPEVIGWESLMTVDDALGMVEHEHPE